MCIYFCVHHLKPVDVRIYFVKHIIRFRTKHDSQLLVSAVGRTGIKTCDYEIGKTIEMIALIDGYKTRDSYAIIKISTRFRDRQSQNFKRNSDNFKTVFLSVLRWNAPNRLRPIRYVLPPAIPDEKSIPATTTHDLRNTPPGRYVYIYVYI